MELISQYFSWCEGGRKSSIDPGDRVSSNASEEEEEEVDVGKKKKQLSELRLGRMKDHCIRGRRGGGATVRIRVRIRANGEE